LIAIDIDDFTGLTSPPTIAPRRSTGEESTSTEPGFID